MAIPTFLIIGVAKAGTTSLYRYLDQHPDVYMCPIKGTNFFGYEDARHWDASEGDAPRLRHFPVHTFDAFEAMFDGAAGQHAIGEASPQYFRCPTAARRIHEALPDVRLIASLRNPADRAFSGFLMRARRGDRVGSVYEELTLDSSHVREGFYYQRLQRYFDLFPKEHLKVLVFEEFARNPSAAVRDLFDFLGVDPTFTPDTSTKHNSAGVPKRRLLNRLFYSPSLIRAAKTVLPEPLQRLAKRAQQGNLVEPPRFPGDLRIRLLDYYRDDIRHLETLLGRDLSIWQPA